MTILLVMLWWLTGRLMVILLVMQWRLTGRRASLACVTQVVSKLSMGLP